MIVVSKNRLRMKAETINKAIMSKIIKKRKRQRRKENYMDRIKLHKVMKMEFVMKFPRNRKIKKMKYKIMMANKEKKTK